MVEKISLSCLLLLLAVATHGQDTLKVATSAKTYAIVSRLTRELDLNSKQQDRMVLVVEERWKKIDQLRFSGKPLDRSEVNTFTRKELNKILTEGQLTKLLELQGEIQQQRADFKRENPNYVFSEDDQDLLVY